MSWYCIDLVYFCLFLAVALIIRLHFDRICFPRLFLLGSFLFASFVDHLCYFCLVLLCFHARLFINSCSHLLGKGRSLGSCLQCLIVTLSVSHWYPGSGVVLDCIDS